MHASEIRELLKLLGRDDIISFAGGIPDPDLFPAEQFQASFTRHMSAGDARVSLQYAASEGFLPLREWISDHMASIGVRCEVDNILLTSGSQQALDYLARLFLNAGDTALVGWPTYMGALMAFNQYEPRFDRLPIQGNLGNAEIAGEAEAAGGRVKLAYVTPDFANPTGETLNLMQREKLLNDAHEMDIAVVEDGAYQALRYEGEDVPPVLALDIQRSGDINSTRTIYCGSFSKTLSPGLRVGWVCGRRDIVQRLVMMKQASDLHSPTVNQIVINDIARSLFHDQVSKARLTYKARLDAMLSALQTQMPEGVSWTKPQGGMFIWVTLPDHMDSSALLGQSLEEAKVAFVPGRPFHSDGKGSNTMRLSFSCMNESKIDEGIRRLGAVLRSRP
jgi:DNA-binding transcriptional MocR family regulator